MADKTTYTISEICDKLRSLAKGTNDLIVYSFGAGQTPHIYRVKNESSGKIGSEINNLAYLDNIHFFDTANMQDTDLKSYMEKFGFNKQNGDGEFLIMFGSKTGTLIMLSIHNSNLGPALGGLREKQYSSLDSMLTDTLRLSRAMTYKAAVANTHSGGGKATRTPPDNSVRKLANEAFARFLNFVNAKRKERNLNPYVTAEDSNTGCTDFDDMDKVCKFTVCKSLYYGGSGNPSPVTAIGVYHAARAAAEFVFEDKSLKNKVVLISGIGQCGYELAKNYVHSDVAKIICAELSKTRIEWVKQQFHRFGKIDKIEFLVYTRQQIKDQKFLADLANQIDIFSPCALGKSINDDNIKALKGSRLKLICGSENNQLADESKHGQMLHDMEIIYVPDYVANAGGLINCVKEVEGRIFLISETVKEAMNIENTTRAILALSEEKNIPPYKAANRLAEQKFKI